jgi:pyrrolidone-carboxylate peptidase
MEPLRVIVTGYGPFGGIQTNPSDVLGRKVSAMGVPGAVVEYRRLDVNHDAVDGFVENVRHTDGFIEEMRHDPPAVIMSLGYGGSLAQVEEQPNNRIGGGREGQTHPKGPIVPGHPEVLKTDLPVTDIEAALSKVKDRTIGTHILDEAHHRTYQPDRSEYLCNYINYRLTDTFGGNDAVGKATTAGFLHVSDATQPEELHAVLQAIVAHHQAGILTP